MLLTILVFLLILSILVTIHELGHFLVAKKFGIKVEEFGFGFPPRVLGIQKGETVYSINWLPIGGFVKLYGEDDAGGGSLRNSDQTARIKDTKRAFFARPVWQRASVVVAGVVMNTLLATFFFYILLGFSHFKTTLPKIGSYTFFGAHQSNLEGIVVNDVAKDSPAEKIGLHPKVRITLLNGRKVGDTKQFISTVNTYKGKEITLSWEDIATGQKFSHSVKLRKNPPPNQGSLGIQFEYVPFPITVISYETPTEKAFSGITHTLNMMPYQLNGISALFAKAFQEKTAAPVGNAVAGPVGIGVLVGSILEIPDVKTALLQLVNLAGILSVSLAFFNVLPIPALDGGRLFFILIEGVLGHKVNPKVESAIHTVGFAVLLTFIIFVTVHDITRLLHISLLPKF